MLHAYTEDQLVEQPAIGLFAERGWTTVSALEETFGATGTLRETKGAVVLFSRLHGTKNVSEVTFDDCREFVFREGTSPRNQINDRLAVSNFLNWCVRRQFATTNHMATVEKPAVDTHEPQVLAVADCRLLLAAARDYKDGLLLPYVAVSLFAGLRPAEIARLTWDRVDLKENTITLDGSMAKTRQRRIVKLPENAVDWLLPLAPKHPDFVPAAFQRHFGRVKHAAGFNGPDGGKDEEGRKLRPWVQDYMRHTAISMYLAKHKHEGEAATWAGNSPNVIHRHYKGLVKEADATEFWKLTPAAVKSDIVTFQAFRRRSSDAMPVLAKASASSRFHTVHRAPRTSLKTQNRTSAVREH